MRVQGKVVDSILQAIAYGGIKPNESRVLAYLAWNPSRTRMIDVARGIRLDKGNATRALQALEKMNLLVCQDGVYGVNTDMPSWRIPGCYFNNQGGCYFNNQESFTFADPSRDQCTPDHMYHGSMDHGTKVHEYQGSHEEKDHGGGVGGTTVVKKTTEPCKKKDPNPFFDSFWQAYPRKVGKKDARRAFDKINPDYALLTTMLEAISMQKKTEGWLKDGGAFIPHPATWLNGQRWEDEIPMPGSEPTRPLSEVEQMEQDLIAAGGVILE